MDKLKKLEVAPQNIRSFLSDESVDKFVVPEYQRPYAWGTKECEDLWDDITDFFHEKEKTNTKEIYFLGTIVMSTTEGRPGCYDIIDGQQRIISLSLLLLAFYKHLKNQQEGASAMQLIDDIESCLWHTDRKTGTAKKHDVQFIRLESKTAIDKHIQTLYALLTVDEAYQLNPSVPYYENFKFFADQVENYSQENPLKYQDLLITILDDCILLPIKCGDTTAALTIFNTLNDRGIPLADADIFKAEMYKLRAPAEQDGFVSDWKILTEKTDDNKDLKIDDLFRYHSYKIRAKDNNPSGRKREKLREFYLADRSKHLREDNLLETLTGLADFWEDINTKSFKAYPKLFSTEAKTYLDCLLYYPNKYWKFPVSVFYEVNYDAKKGREIVPGFKKRFEKLVRVLVAFLFLRYVDDNTIEAIRDDIFNVCRDIIEGQELKFNLQFFNGVDNWPTEFEKCPEGLKRGLLALYAYLKKETFENMTSQKWQIEHILPKNWQNTNYRGWSEDTAQQWLERLGNLVHIERAINIKAGNDYFGRKKAKYKASKFKEVQKLADLDQDDWWKEDIERREQEFITAILNFCKSELGIS